MIQIFLVGNLTNDPELRVTPSGVSVCCFTVAAKRRHGREDATEFVRVSVWRQLGEICSQFLSKGKKVAVQGEVTAKAYASRDGQTRASLEVTANEVEFLSPRSEEREPVSTAMPSYSQEQLDHARKTAEDAQFTEITDGDLPF